MSGDQGEPRYQHIKQQLREMIARGEYEADVPFITQRQICERFGVSMGTAVRALNDLVTEGILVRHRGRGTFVTEASPLVGPINDSRSIALIMHGEGPYQSGLLKAIGAVCSDHNYRLFVSDTSDSAEQEDRALRQALDSAASGVLLYPRQGTGPLSRLTELRQQRIPTVLIDRYLPQFAMDAVLPDHFAVGYQLTQELINRGHQRIGTLWGEYECTSVSDRVSGHVQALRDNGLPVLPDFTTLRPYLTLSERKRKEFLAGWLQGSEPPTVLLCANGYVLAAAANDLLDLGMAIPDDVDLAGMDDAGPFDLLPLTCVAAVLPVTDIGTTAARLLIDQIEGGGELSVPRHQVLPVGIRVRESAKAHLRPITT